MEGVESMEADKAARHAEVWGRYRAEAGRVREALLEAVERESADFRSRMEASEVGILDLMGHLEEGRVMVLELEGVEQVWTDVRGELQERVRWISEFMQALTEGERERKAAMDELLYSSLAAMVDVAHLSDGEIQRLVESEALALNKDVLQNQRSYADLSLRLQSKEVDLEEQKRGEWERGLESWRLLRSEHTMKTFTETIRSAEFVEPEDRLGIFADIRAEQEDVHSMIRGHVRSALRLLPPQHVSHGAVMQWISEANFLDDWDAALTRHIERLEEQEVRQKERAMAMFADLQAAVRGYNPWPVDEQTRRLEDECLTVELERQSSVGGLIRDTEAFLRFQAETWRDTCLLLGEFLRGIMARTENHYESINSLNGAADEALKTCRSTFDEDDRAREESLECERANLRQGSSEKRLDEQVINALARLDSIEEGYRQFHSDMITIVQQHPISMRRENDTYHCDLAELIGVQPQVDRPVPEKPPADHGEDSGGEPEEGEGEGDGGGAEASAQALQDARDGNEGEGGDGTAVNATDEVTMTVGSVETPHGGVFMLVTDLYEYAMAPVLRKLARGVCRDGEPTTSEAEGGGALAERGEDGGTEAEPESGSEGEEGVEFGEEASRTSPAKQGGGRIPKPPRRADGETLCVLVLEVSRTEVESVLHSTQVSMLGNLEEIVEDTSKSTQDWATDLEETLTDELDENLRSHRPRAGRIEEEDREHRSVELASQKRRFDRHTRALAQYVKASIADLAAAQESTENDLDKQVERLIHAETLLGTAGSVKALEIRKRETNKMHSFILQKVGASCQRLREKASKAKEHLSEMNEKFIGSLKTFEDGGLYNLATVEATKARLQASVQQAHVDLESQENSTEGTEEQAKQKVEAAMQSFDAITPAHIQDLEVLEAIDAALNHASSALRMEVARSTEAGSRITGRLQALEEAITSGDSATCTCQGLLCSIDDLRSLILPRTMYLGCLLSKMSLEPVDTLLKEEAPQTEAADAPGGNGKTAKDRGGKPESELHLNQVTEKIVEECRSRLTKVCEDYYSAKESGREITRPDRILATVKDMKAKNEAILVKLHDQAEQHLTSAVTEVKSQVLQLSRALEKAAFVALNTLVQEIVSKVQRNCLDLSEPFDKAFDEAVRAKKRNSKLLRPGLQNPHMASALQELCDQEGKRALDATSSNKEHMKKILRAIQTQSSFVHGRLEDAVGILLKLVDGCVLPRDIPVVTPEEAELIGFKPKSVLKLNAIEKGLQEEAVRHDVEGRPFKRREAGGLDAGALTLKGLGLDVEMLSETLGFSADDLAEFTEEKPLESATMTYLETAPGRAVIIARDKLFHTMKEAMGTLAAHYRTQLQERAREEAAFAREWQQAIAFLQEI